MPLPAHIELKRINGARVPSKPCENCGGAMKNVHVLRRFCGSRCQGQHIIKQKKSQLFSLLKK